LAAQSRRIETEAAPIWYVAQLVGTDTDSERAIRWLIALMVFCCDPRGRSWAGYTINTFEFEFPTGTGTLEDEVCRVLEQGRTLSEEMKAVQREAAERTERAKERTRAAIERRACLRNLEET
jgi:hypothetical protein